MKWVKEKEGRGTEMLGKETEIEEKEKEERD